MIARRPGAYLQACHNLAWLARDDVDDLPIGLGLASHRAGHVRALEAISVLGDQGFTGCTPEEYVQAAIDLLNLASADMGEPAKRGQRAALKRLEKRVAAALSALARGAK